MLDFDLDLELGSVVDFKPESRDVMGVFKHANGGEQRLPVVGWATIAVESGNGGCSTEVVALFLKNDVAVLWTQQELAGMDLNLASFDFGLRWL